MIVINRGEQLIGCIFHRSRVEPPSVTHPWKNDIWQEKERYHLERDQCPCLPADVWRASTAHPLDTETQYQQRIRERVVETRLAKINCHQSGPALRCVASRRKQCVNVKRKPPVVLKRLVQDRRAFP